MELGPLVKCAALAGDLRGRHPGIMRLAWPRFKEKPRPKGVHRGGQVGGVIRASLAARWLQLRPVGSVEKLNFAPLVLFF
jgi:hypothetical protein